MSNVIPHNTLISSDHSFQFEGDFNLILTLLRKNPLYNVPPHLRDAMIKSCSEQIGIGTPKMQMVASKIILEMDKRNIDIVKMAVPKHVVHHKAEDLTDDELKAELQKLVDQGQLAPALTEGIIDG